MASACALYLFYKRANAKKKKKNLQKERVTCRVVVDQLLGVAGLDCEEGGRGRGKKGLLLLLLVCPSWLFCFVLFCW